MKMGGSKTDVCIAMYLANTGPICPESEQISQRVDLNYKFVHVKKFDGGLNYYESQNYVQCSN